MSLLFPDRYGALTRDCDAPSVADRIAAWFERSAPLRAAATLGDERTLDCVPNIVPMRRPLSRMQVVRAALLDHCKLVGLSDAVAEDAISCCRYWLSQDTTLTSGELIRKGKRKCSSGFVRTPDPQGAA